MIVSAEWLAKNLKDPQLRIIDCRYLLGKPGAGLEEYKTGHIPGAIPLDVDRDLSRPGGLANGGPGRHPIPKTTEFATTMSNAGIDSAVRVVAYDDAGGAYAARLWWLLRYFGHESVSLLNGGWTQWVFEKRPISNAEVNVKARAFKATPHRNWAVDKNRVAQILQSGADAPTSHASKILLLDARAPERYRGETEPIDKQSGHIPGAKNAPFASNLESPHKTFKSPEKLREQFAALGTDSAREIICYCGSGVTACHDIFALKLAGWDAKLYEGSWSDWANDATLPIEKG